MALSFGATKLARQSGSTNPITQLNINIAANEKILVLMIKVRGSTTRTGGAPTFGGVAMIQANSNQIAAASPEASAELWYMLDPPTGNSTLSIPNTAAQTIFYTLVTATSSASKAGSVYLAANNGGNNTSTNPTPGTVIINEVSAIGFAITAGGWTTWAPSAQAGTVLANSDDGADGGGEQYLVVNTPGSYTLNWTFGTSDDWGAVVAFFAEEPGVIFNNYLFVEVGDGMSTGDKIR